MFAGKERNLPLGPHTAHLIPNLCALIVRSGAPAAAATTAASVPVTSTATASAGSGSASATATATPHPHLNRMSVLLSSLSRTSATLHFLHVDMNQAIVVVSRTPTPPATATATASGPAPATSASASASTSPFAGSDVLALIEAFSSAPGGVATIEPCALLSSPPITHIPAVTAYLAKETTPAASLIAANASADAKSKSVAPPAKVVHYKTNTAASQFILYEATADIVVTDLQFLVTSAHTAETESKSAAAADPKAAAAAHSDHRVESIKQTTTKLAFHPWWEGSASALLSLYNDSSKCKETDALYVYRRDTIVERASLLKSLKNVNRVFYAMKANGNPDVLRIIVEAGIGLECVSIDELSYVRALFPTLPGTSFLFTPNFAAKSEYEYAYSIGAYVNLDNIYPIQTWPSVFAGREFLVRIDPGEGKGHHSKVVTGGAQSKFGVSVDQLAILLPLVEANKSKIIGLHIHAGSGVMEPHLWETNAQFLGELLAKFPHLRILDLGGGLGVPYQFESAHGTPLDVSALNTRLAAFKASHPVIELWLEPGRFLVAESGVLLARVTQVKAKGSTKRFVGINTGMNALIRPALYGSYHHILNLSHYAKQVSGAAPSGDGDMHTVDVVGPICESGDVLGHDRLFPKSTAAGDVVLVSTIGAYGRVMSSNYNRRPTPTEIII